AGAQKPGLFCQVRRRRDRALERPDQGERRVRGLSVRSHQYALPFVPAKAGTQRVALDSRHKRVYARLRRAMRGNERGFGARSRVSHLDEMWLTVPSGKPEFRWERAP